MSLPTRSTCLLNGWSWLKRATEVGDRLESLAAATTARAWFDLARLTEDPLGDDEMRYRPDDEETP